MGDRIAEDIMPEEIDSWLSSSFKTPATMNRYRDFLSLCYREGVRNRKVTVNPARLVHKRKEPVGRSRFLSREEYARLRAVIAKRSRSIWPNSPSPFKPGCAFPSSVDSNGDRSIWTAARST
jgi:hypothetical protein